MPSLLGLLEENSPESSIRFTGNANANEESDIANSGSTADEKQRNAKRSMCLQLSLPEALEDVGRFLETLSDLQDKSKTPQVPKCVGTLLDSVEEMITGYDSWEKFGQNREGDALFVESLNRVSTLIHSLSEFTSNSETGSYINRASNVIHLAMVLLDGEFRAILDSVIGSDSLVEPRSSEPLKQSSFNFRQETDGCIIYEPGPSEVEEFPSYSEESITNMNRIASAMISSGYQKECCIIYNMARRNALDYELQKLGFKHITAEDLHRLQWQLLEGEIAAWIDMVKHCSSVLFSKEHNLCSSVFSQHSSIAERLFADIIMAVTVRFLNFAESVVLTTRSPEKLFKFLDIYETLRDIGLVNVENPYMDNIKSETVGTRTRIREAVVSIFCDLENSIKRDNGRIPVPGGAVHPLTRYTMNYLKYACEYKSTLEEVFHQHHKIKGSLEANWKITDLDEANEDGTPRCSPFSAQLNMAMDLLDDNLDMKSKLYRDHALRYVFLMNNGRYILQKIKESNEIRDMMGVTWCRKRSSDLRMYHKSYTRETWTKVVQCLSHEALQVNGKVSKPILKERFKFFNTMFDEIHKTQSTWVVSDGQLKSELRISVSAVVIPAYRSFVGRFGQVLLTGRQSEKYVKYQPEDIENLIEGLFDGNHTSMGKRRT